LVRKDFDMTYTDHCAPLVTPLRNDSDSPGQGRARCLTKEKYKFNYDIKESFKQKNCKRLQAAGCISKNNNAKNIYEIFIFYQKIMKDKSLHPRVSVGVSQRKVVEDAVVWAWRIDASANQTL